MGAVYEATCGTESVAIKVPYCEVLDDDTSIRRFRDEGIAGSIVEHPNLARVIRQGETESGIPYLVMEQIHGEHLCARVGRNRALSLRKAAVFVRQLLDGLAALHASGIVHGDVKSDNILVERHADGSEVARLIDFGLAHAELESESTPADHLVSGTPDYMAPEVVRGAGSTPASDLYAAGVILYELITGSTPFGGGPSSEILQRHLTEDVIPPSLRRVDREIPPILERIVMRALEKHPSKRFASAGAFASALAVALPVLDDTTPYAPTTFSSELPTLEWQTQKPRRVARGTPPVAGRRKR